MKGKKFFANMMLAVALTGGVGLISGVTPALADDAGGGTVNKDVSAGINDSIATVKALSPLALACLSVALVPLGSMLTLRFLNMVLSRV